MSNELELLVSGVLSCKYNSADKMLKCKFDLWSVVAVFDIHIVSFFEMMDYIADGKSTFKYNIYGNDVTFSRIITQNTDVVFVVYVYKVDFSFSLRIDYAELFELREMLVKWLLDGKIDKPEEMPDSYIKLLRIA